MATKTAAVDAKGYRKFGFRDVLAYGFRGFGCNMSSRAERHAHHFLTQYMGIDSILMASPSAARAGLGCDQRPCDRRDGRREDVSTSATNSFAYIWAGSVGLLVAGALCFVPRQALPTL